MRSKSSTYVSSRRTSEWKKGNVENSLGGRARAKNGGHGLGRSEAAIGDWRQLKGKRLHRFRSEKWTELEGHFCLLMICVVFFVFAWLGLLFEDETAQDDFEQTLGSLI